MSRAGRLLTAAALALVGPLLAGTAALAADAPGSDREEKGVPIQVVIPDSSRVELDSAVLTWGINAEVGGGAFAGGCNFLSAGAAGNAERSRVWTEDDGFYKTRDGNVSIEKPDANGTYGTPTWATKCQDPQGKAVVASRAESRSQNRVVIGGGTGVVDHATGTAQIQWRGSFTVVFYGGMTYWTATDPTLTVEADGTGTLTATGSGYGADMTDTGRWVPLRPRPITLATFHDVSVAAPDSVLVTPDYLGVAVDTRGGAAQTERTEANADYWGAFPQDFVDFQQETGQSAYWYASGGSRDRAKVAEQFAVGYGAPVSPPGQDVPGGGAAGGGTPAPDNPLNPRPAGLNPLPVTVNRPAGGGAPLRRTRAAPRGTRARRSRRPSTRPRCSLPVRG